MNPKKKKELQELVRNELAHGVVIVDETAYIWADFLSAFEEDDEERVVAHDVFMEIIRAYRFSAEWHRGRWNILQKWQATIPDPYRQEVCDILANGMSYRWNERVENISERRQYLVRLINRLDDEEQYVDAVDEAINELRKLL